MRESQRTVRYPVALYFAFASNAEIAEMKAWLRQRLSRDLYLFAAHLEQVHFAHEHDAMMFRLAFE